VANRRQARATLTLLARKRRIDTAIDQTLNVDKARTGDLGGHSSTGEFTRALVKRIANA